MPPDDTGLALRTVGAFRLSRAVWLAARLRLADLVGEGSASVTELAAASDTDALERLMQALAAFGVHRREDGGRFAQTPTSEADPFPPFAFAVDVGGSQGSLLRRLLERQPHARGLLFDLPEVIARWRAGQQDDVDGRLSTVAGDFFEAVPAGGDLYLLKFIVHDWDDERALAILRHVRDAVAPGGRLALVETVLPDTPTEHAGWLFDLNMLAVTGGRERTAQELTALLDRAGWAVERVTSTASPLSVIVAAPAGSG